ncbi:MAG: hypothetical protein IIZ56_04955 [Clostridia bacterium]|nr:hypothetical protein [Clostridia bacterium]
MKVTKLNEYAPGYPAKKKTALKIGTIAAAALLAASVSAGCTVSASGFLQDPPAISEEPVTPEPTEELCIPGEPAVDENGNIIPDETEAPVLMGDVQIAPDAGNGG